MQFVQSTECKTETSASRALAVQPKGKRRPGFTSSLLLNALALGALWVIYSAVRTVTADSWGAARSNADRLLAFQDSLGLPSEAVMQQLFLPYEWLVRGANMYYLGMHFPSMVVFLVWALFLKREAMPRIRLALIGSTLIGLVIHLAFPLAPPRMLRFSGFVDTASIFGPDPYALGIAKAANELAAMPSMHVGWALLIALAVVKVTRTRWRWLVLAHPIITSVVVVVTANHYWTDVAVGAALASLGWWIAGFVRPEPGAEPALELVEVSCSVASGMSEDDDELVSVSH